MAQVIIPNKASKDVILIDGICYKLLTSTSQPATHSMDDIDGQFDTCAQCAEAEKSDLSSSSSQSAAETKTIFGLSWTKNETKLIDGFYGVDVVYSDEQWKKSDWPGTNNYFNMTNVFLGFTGSAFFNLRDGGTEAPFHLNMQMQAFGTTFSNASTLASTNIAIKWITAYGLNAPYGRIGSLVWGTSGARGSVTLSDNSPGVPQGETIEWWRSGNDTNIKISW
jgi:hypothetical protein